RKTETLLQRALDDENADAAEAANRVIEQYRSRHALDDEDGKEARREARLLNEQRRIRLAALAAERDELYRLRRAHKISDTLHHRLVHEIDLAETALSARPELAG